MLDRRHRRKRRRPIFERFTEVTILDSTDDNAAGQHGEQFRGCGGSYGGGKAALKLQVEFDLRSGALSHIEIEPGRSPDGATSRQEAEHPVRFLADHGLGLFQRGGFCRDDAGRCVFSLAFAVRTSVDATPGNRSTIFCRGCRNSRGRSSIKWFCWAREQRLLCRLIAWRLPEEQANRRRRKLRKETMSKRNQEPSAERLAWCDWTILVTSVPDEMLTPKK